jgi:hypothetical protein
MTSLVNTYVLPLMSGTNFLYANRRSRSLAVGSHEQVFFCSLDWLDRISQCFIESESTLSIFYSKTTISHLSWAGSGAIVSLYYLKNHLDEKEYPSLKKDVDFIFSQVPNFILIASVLQSVVGLYFGVNTTSHLIHLGFYLLSFLEQGISWEKIEENHGPLFQFMNGNLVHYYDTTLGQAYSWFGIPHQLIYGGLFTKLVQLGKIFLILPDELQDRSIKALVKFLSSFSSNMQTLSNDIDTQTEKSKEQNPVTLTDHLNIDLAPIPNKEEKECYKKISPDLKLRMTEKFLELFTLDDPLPDTSLQTLKNQVQDCLENDETLNSEETKKLQELLGKEGKLVTYIVGADDDERGRFMVNAKIVYQALLQDWNHQKMILLRRHRDFLCKAAITSEMQKLALEMSDLSPTDPLEEEDREKIGVAKEIALVLQQYRDLVFTRRIQYLLNNIKSSFDAFKDIGEKIKSEFPLPSFDLTEMQQTGWWIQFFKGLGAEILSFATLITLDFQKESQTNRHAFNTYLVVFGKEGGLSTYQDAVRDFNLANIGNGAPPMVSRKVLEKIPVGMGAYSDIQFQYLRKAKAHLREVIFDKGDDRLQFSPVRDVIRKIGRDRGFGDEIDKEALQIYEREDQVRLKEREFLDTYFPLLLHELDYYTVSTDDRDQEPSHDSADFFTQKQTNHVAASKTLINSITETLRMS